MASTRPRIGATFFCNHLLEHRLVETEIGDELFEHEVLSAQVAQLADLAAVN
jgi:hypothetical protein